VLGRGALGDLVKSSHKPPRAIRVYSYYYINFSVGCVFICEIIKL